MRRTRYTPALVENTSSTAVGSCGPARVERMRSREESAGSATSPYRAKTMASIIVVLPDPVGPVSRNRPEAPTASKSMRSLPA